MIKTITTMNWDEIESEISKFPEDKQRIYHDLRDKFESETSKPSPNHNQIADMIAKAYELLE